jgi:hypothetical protein
MFCSNLLPAFSTLKMEAGSPPKLAVHPEYICTFFYISLVCAINKDQTKYIKAFILTNIIVGSHSMLK